MKHFCGISGINLSGMYRYWKKIMFYFSQRYGIYNRCISALALYNNGISCRSWTPLCRAGSAGNELTKMTSEENLCGFLFPFKAVFSLSCLRRSSFDSELSTEEVDAEVMLLGARLPCFHAHMEKTTPLFTVRRRQGAWSRVETLLCSAPLWAFSYLRCFIPFVSLWDFKECECVCVCFCKPFILQCCVWRDCSTKITVMKQYFREVLKTDTYTTHTHTHGCLLM